MVVIQLAGDDNVIQILRDHLKPPKPFGKMGKKQLLTYIDKNQILPMYETFHGEHSDKELFSAVKSIYKGKQTSLPVTMKTMRSLKPAALRLFLEDFMDDIRISSPKLGAMNEKRRESHIKRFRYKEMLAKVNKLPQTSQIQFVNQLNMPGQGGGEESEAPKKGVSGPKVSVSGPTPAPQNQAPTPMPIPISSPAPQIITQPAPTPSDSGVTSDQLAKFVK